MIRSFAEWLESAEAHGLDLPGEVLRREVGETGASAEKVRARIADTLAVMRRAVQEGLETTEATPSGLTGGRSARLATDGPGLLGAEFTAMLSRAIATLETNARMGLIMATPTAGAAGVVPAVLLTLAPSRGWTDERLADAMLVAGGTGIIIADRHYAQARRSVDFIQKYIFPGSCLPSEGSLRAALETTSLRVEHVDDIGLHYVPTLRAWCRRFLERVDRVRALGYPERLIRLWEYYFRYCEAGFAERYLGDLQILLRKPPAAARGVRTADAEAA